MKDVKNKVFPNVYLMTVSEPLGLVPQEMWAKFPKYDNPGLFKDDFLRTGMVKTDWNDTVYGKRHLLSFDDEAYLKCIQKLADVIGIVLSQQNTPIISFVDAKTKTTHGHMLDLATENYGLNIARYDKKSRLAAAHTII